MAWGPSPLHAREVSLAWIIPRSRPATSIGRGRHVTRQAVRWLAGPGLVACVPISYWPNLPGRACRQFPFTLPLPPTSQVRQLDDKLVCCKYQNICAYHLFFKGNVLWSRPFAIHQHVQVLNSRKALMYFVDIYSQKYFCKLYLWFVYVNVYISLKRLAFMDTSICICNTLFSICRLSVFFIVFYLFLKVMSESEIRDFLKLWNFPWSCHFKYYLQYSTATLLKSSMNYSITKTTSLLENITKKYSVHYLDKLNHKVPNKSKADKWSENEIFSSFFTSIIKRFLHLFI
jgi:hypothetical protein